MVGYIITVIGLIITWLIAAGLFLSKKRNTNPSAVKYIVILISFIFLMFQSAPEWSTYSYFSSGAALQNVFTAGTWEIPEDPEPPVENGSAWAGEIPFSGGIAKYFTYQLNQGTVQNPVSANLYQGAKWEVTGNVSVWNTQDTLYIKVTTQSAYGFKSTHMYPGLVPPEKHSPGNLGYAYGSSLMTEYTYTVSSVYTDWHNNPDKRKSSPVASLQNGATIHIAVHADVHQADMKPNSLESIGMEGQPQEQPEERLDEQSTEELILIEEQSLEEEQMEQPQEEQPVEEPQEEEPKEQPQEEQVEQTEVFEDDLSEDDLSIEERGN